MSPVKVLIIVLTKFQKPPSNPLSLNPVLGVIRSLCSTELLQVTNRCWFTSLKHVKCQLPRALRNVTEKS